MNLNMYCIWSHHKMLFLVCVSRILCSLQMELDRPGHGPKGDCLHTTRCHEGKHFWWRGDDCTFQTVTNWMQTIFQGCHEHNMFAFFFLKKTMFWCDLDDCIAHKICDEALFLFRFNTQGGPACSKTQNVSQNHFPDPKTDVWWVDTHRHPKHQSLKSLSLYM